jgi:hypothetical protein
VTEPEAPAARLVHFGAADVRDVVLGASEGGKSATGLLDAEGLAGRLRIREASPGGWAAHLDALRALRDADGPPAVVIASASEEIADPSPDAGESLRSLAGAVREAGGRLVVLNGSTLTPGEAAGDEDEPMDLRIRRLNLATLEASKATGLCVLDVDRIVASASTPSKVLRPFDYSTSICETVQAELVRILRELGVAGERSVMELTVPFVKRASGLTLTRWLKDQGEQLAPDDVICELRLLGVRSIARPTNALMLAAIDQRGSWVQRLFNRERTYDRASDATVSIVAADTGVLRSIERAPGEVVRPNDRLALLTTGQATPLGDGRPGPFRALALVDEPREEPDR